jgi:hypothetical protein
LLPEDLAAVALQLLSRQLRSSIVIAISLGAAGRCGLQCFNVALEVPVDFPAVKLREAA